MTPEQLAEIKARDGSARVYPDPKDLLEWALSDCRALLVWADELAAEREAFRIETVEMRHQIRELRAVIAAADTWLSAYDGPDNGPTLTEHEAMNAYRAARAKLAAP